MVGRQTGQLDLQPSSPSFTVSNTLWLIKLLYRILCCMQLQTRSATAETPSTADRQGTEALLIRNHDANRVADLTVEIADLDESIVFDEKYQIKPLITEVVDLPLSRGTYQVSVTLDESVIHSTSCYIGYGPMELACIEIGNGVVSVTDGL